MRFAVGLLAVATAAAQEQTIFEKVGPFGPRAAGFPWHCAFSPDGKWVAFLDGRAGSLSVWGMEERREAWRADLQVGSHEIAFAPDSRRFATVARDALVVVSLGEKGWEVERRIPRGFAATVGMAVSPLPFDFSTEARHALLSDEGSGFDVEIEKGAVRRMPGEAKVRHYLTLRDGAVAQACLEPFGTKILFDRRGARTLADLLLAASADGALWLACPSADAYGSAAVRLAIVESEGAKELARFDIGGGGRRIVHRPLVQAFFSPDGKLLVTVEGTGEIVVRDARTGKPRQTIREYADLPYALGAALSPDGKLLVTGGRRVEGESHAPGVLLWRSRDSGK